MKKAQLMSQPFYYIFVIIVIAMILIFGFNLINNLIKTQEKAKFIQFKTDFKGSVENVYVQNPGTKISFSLLVPKDLNKVCFEKIQNTVEVSSDSEYFISFNEDRLTHNKQNPYCIKASGKKIGFSLENKILNSKTYIEIS